MRWPLWASSAAASTALCLVVGVGALVGFRFGFMAGAGASLLAATLVTATGLAAAFLVAATRESSDAHDVFPQEGEC